MKLKMKWIKTIDISLFILCSINLILWIMRSLYVIEAYTSTPFEWIYDNLFIPMVVGVFLLPTLVIATLINRKVELQSFTFLSLKCIALTVLLILILK
ncbi:hypothetical protein [Myroides phaeus]|uniref:hypothetical protein n=1 Tax=Myroides phaeus TaxID=702745 RepID=UPI0013038022|nr:hypothetical protein [Myroides phaeus]